MTLGLENMNALVNKLEINFSKNAKLIYVIGTNGKGTVAEKVFQGFQVLDPKNNTGMFTSPHLNSIRERFRVNNSYISFETIDRLCSRIEAASIAINRQPTFFEAQTLLSLLYFQEEDCKNIVIEAGLGGELDSTNFSTSLKRTFGLTSISLDHTEILGKTKMDILRSEIGIVNNQDLIILPEFLDQDLMNECKRRLQPEQLCFLNKEIKAIFTLDHCIGVDNMNNALALQLLQQVFNISKISSISRTAVNTIRNTNPQMRFQMFNRLNNYYAQIAAGHREFYLEECRKGRILILDIAHNPDSLLLLRSRLEYLAIEAQTHLTLNVVMTLSGAKDIKDCLKSILGGTYRHSTIQQVSFVPLQFRGHKLDDLVVTASKYNVDVKAYNSFSDAGTNFTFKENQINVICGSFLMMDDVIAFLNISEYYLPRDCLNMNEA